MVTKRLTKETATGGEIRMTTEEIVKQICKEQGMSVAKLAAALGQSRQNFYKKLQRDTLTAQEWQEAAKVLASSGFDIEIVEKHHNQKKDAPSGTALALAESMNEALGNQYHYVYDRSSVHEKRDPKEIGIASVRGGSIVGDHDVIFAGKDEVITFNHTAYSKAIFAKGALEAAKFLAGKEPGLYDMSDVVQL